MADFAEYRCWDPDEVNKIALIDVAGLEHQGTVDAAVFLATHHPLHVMRVASPGAQEGELVSEVDLLADFAAPLGADPRISVISGGVGTGKSHLIKWLHANSSGQASWHQVYVEKRNTNLRSVIRLMLEGMSGPRVTELRKQLDEASSAYHEPAETADRVLHELSHLVGHPSHEVVANSREAHLRQELPALLNDPVLRRHLLAKQGPVYRITELGLKGQSYEGDEEADLFFDIEDLPLDPSDLLDASKPAQAILRQLAHNEALRSLAVELLNEELARAKAAVFLGAGLDLIGVFDEVRVELGKRGQDLVLYIEDLVLLHGIDRELAHVFTQGRGLGDGCGMRVAIAATDGYLASGFDTLNTRAEHYSLNLRLGDHISPADARGFVGRYLNAIRLGTSELKRARNPGVEDWLPNACDRCEFRDECHNSVAFGADPDRHGFYPLNEAAVDRLVELVGKKVSKEVGRFDPREVLRHVVRDPLAVASAELGGQKFPSARFGAALDPIRENVAVQVRSDVGGSPEGDRRITLLSFWHKGLTAHDRNLDDTIHDAFRLPKADLDDATTTTEDDVEDETAIRREREDPDLKAIEDWANGAVLTSQAARRVRQGILSLLIETVRHGPSGLSVQGEGKKQLVGKIPIDEHAIRIEGAAGAGTEVARHFEVALARSPHNAVVFKALLAAVRKGAWSPENFQAYADLIAMVDREAELLIKKASAKDVDLAPAIAMLLLVNHAAVTKADSTGERLEVMLQGPPHSEPRNKPWRDWAAVAGTARTKSLEVLRRTLTAGKGTGGASFMDAAPALDAGAFRKPPSEVGKTLKGSQEFVDLQRKVQVQQQQTSEQEWTVVQKLVDQIDPHLAMGSNWRTIRKGVSDAVEEAHHQGVLLDAGARDELADLAELVPEHAVAELPRLATRDADRELWDLIPDPVPGLEALDRYVRRADKVFTGLEASLAGEAIGATGSLGVGDVSVGIRGLADLIDEFTEGVSS